MGSAGLRRRPITNVRTWPILPVNEGLNGAESDFRFVLESGRSEYRYRDRAVRLLMAAISTDRRNTCSKSFCRCLEV